MPTLHIANTQFEWELTHSSSLQKSFEVHPFHIQLQFLPFLYAPPQDRVLLFHRPNDDYFTQLKSIRHDHPEPMFSDALELADIDQIDSWGASSAIAKWAHDHQLTYHIPAMNLIKQLAAKSYAFKHFPKLLHAAALHNELELEEWLKGNFWPKVLKTNYATAGRGHRIIRCKTALHYNELIKFCSADWNLNLPVIAEPWIEKKQDFSYQWHISPSIKFLGFTQMLCSPRGTYRGSMVTPCKHPTILPVLEKIQSLGYFGPLGIDGFNFTQGTHFTEINLRKTLGWVALQLGKSAQIAFVKPQEAKHPLLPFSVQGHKPFKLQLDLLSTSLLY